MNLRVGEFLNENYKKRKTKSNILKCLSLNSRQPLVFPLQIRQKNCANCKNWLNQSNLSVWSLWCIFCLIGFLRFINKKYDQKHSWSVKCERIKKYSSRRVLRASDLISIDMYSRKAGENRNFACSYGFVSVQTVTGSMVGEGHFEKHILTLYFYRL